jgi:hypothetical protein
MKNLYRHFFVVIIIYFSGCGSISSGLGPVEFSPSSGAIGTLVTLNGIDFTNAQSVTIGGTAVIPISTSASSYVGFVMPGTVSGPVVVTTSTVGDVTSLGSFEITATGVPRTQQGSKLVGSGAVASRQGVGGAISADGNTALIAGYSDSGSIGGTWIFTRSGGVWSQQGSKLVGTGAVGAAAQGSCNGLSADGNTALIGGVDDDGGIGATWVFTRSGGVWSQQGSKLVGSGAVGNAEQGGWGTCTLLSADGNTALIGGASDDGGVGATWVFTRSGSVWSQQGSKLVGSGAVGFAYQAIVALSADGNTAMIGGAGDDSSVGAAWIFTRNGEVWTQQGSKLVGTGAVGAAGQGEYGALSADGNTALVTGRGDNGSVGAVWVFTRSNGVWSQQGTKLVGSGAVGASEQGIGVSLTADGNTAMIGGVGDNGNAGATWVFTRSGGVWTQQGSKLIGTGAVGAARQGQLALISADGSTALSTGWSDNGNIGAGWIFTP